MRQKANDDDDDDDSGAIRADPRMQSQIDELTAENALLKQVWTAAVLAVHDSDVTGGGSTPGTD